MTSAPALEHRCIECNKLLAKGELSSSKIEIKCNRCSRFNFFFDKEPDQIVITDLNGTIMYTNQSLTKITGYSVAEMIGKNPSLWGKQMSQTFYKNLWTRLKNKEVVVTKITNKRKNGELYDAILRISPILDKDGQPKFFIGVETEIKNQKRKKKTPASPSDDGQAAGQTKKRKNKK